MAPDMAPHATVSPGSDASVEAQRAMTSFVPVRLRRRPEFLRVAGKGRKAPMPGLVLQALERGDDAVARIGFTVTKKVGNAVRRNRARRRLKEAARLLLAEAPVMGADLVVIGRDGTVRRTFQDLIGDLRRALERTGVRRCA